jgi:tRNA(Ser,Leu) C12 N-acetylase TAN1
MDLLISYAWSHFYRAKPETIHILKRFGDPAPWIEKTGVMGIAVAHTCLYNREVIKRCRALWESELQDSFEFAIKWVPVDYWCETGLDAMKQVIDSHIKERIRDNQTWSMKVYKRRWQQYHTIEIVEYLAADIQQKVDLGNPDWILCVNVIGQETAISLLKPEEVFSLGRPYPRIAHEVSGQAGPGGQATVKGLALR